jgi:hypothetical protein
MAQPHTDNANVHIETRNRRAAILERLNYALDIQQQLAGGEAGTVLGVIGVSTASTSVRRDDANYVLQVMVPRMQEMLGLADRPDLVVKARLEVIQGPCPCDGVCRCAVHRKVHVMLYPNPKVAPPLANAHAQIGRVA